MNDSVIFTTAEPNPKRPAESDKVSIPDLDLHNVDFSAGGKYFDASQPPGQQCGVMIWVDDPDGRFEWPVSEHQWPYEWPYWRGLAP